MCGHTYIRQQEAPRIARTRLLYSAKASQRRDKRPQHACSHDRCCGRSGIRHVKRHTHHARFRYQEEHQREESSPRPGGSLRRPRRARPRLFRHQYRMPQQTFEKTNRYTASPASTRPPFPRTLLDEMMSCIHQQCCTERESVLPTISHSPLTHSAI